MSFNIGLSGLRAAQMDLSITGNNIANASTVGFKQSRAEFGDVYSASILGTGRNSTGAGVLVERVSQQHTQGNINYTDRALDMAIEGNGYFILSNNGQIEYTRAGYFDLDKEGYITNNVGKRLQGYTADLQGNVQGIMGDMRLSQTNVEPNATSKVDVELNLDSRKENLNIALFNPNDRTTYSDANSTAVYDSLGIEHVITQY
ncbi:MAG: flagellar hook-basal body complex protein, partial [Marinospirillum sp.]|uniref:flagellar hook-basal body complex protein n=1 Tax=Marinospirillum sp. TaxID=2183934 RepID=UPI0019D8B3B6